MEERRQESRVPCVIEATWHGQSGAQSCRVTDMSWTGCFVQAVYAPEVGSHALITVTLGDERISVQGAVRYVESRMGFAVKFEEITDAQAKAMATVLGEQAVALAVS